MTITGTNFATGATVTFGSTAATNVAVVNSTTITATTPAGSAGAVTVTVTNHRRRAAAWPAVTPTSCADGDQREPEQRTGGGRDSGDHHRDELRHGCDSDLRQRGGHQRGGGQQHDHHGDHAGGSAGAVTVTVTVGGQSGSLANGYTYIGTPTVTSVSPNNGPAAGGTAVTITGTNFASGATVKFGSNAATNVVVVNSTTITATTPAGSAGAVTVTVTNTGSQSGSLANGFTYNASVAIGFAQVASADSANGYGDGERELTRRRRRRGI